ncbi:hypothetical protein [Paludibacterium denitrificans]|uniref:hypothetical protein n=1 Tax=Paludibacterium denitrificans TaxID=2675226 RepID=UPI001E331D78|nr:hypothetical protein [Paludibacterium denitrificans]
MIMLIFWDAEFTDFIDCELISIGMVSEDGQHELYLEVQDFDLSKCRAFVQSTVWSQLGQVAGASVSRGGLGKRLRDWFERQPIASDSQHDRDLLADALEGEWSENLEGWYDTESVHGQCRI